MIPIERGIGRVSSINGGLRSNRTGRVSSRTLGRVVCDAFEEVPLNLAAERVELGSRETAGGGIGSGLPRLLREDARSSRSLRRDIGVAE